MYATDRNVSDLFYLRMKLGDSEIIYLTYKWTLLLNCPDVICDQYEREETNSNVSIPNPSDYVTIIQEVQERSEGNGRVQMFHSNICDGFSKLFRALFHSYDFKQIQFDNEVPIEMSMDMLQIFQTSPSRCGLLRTPQLFESIQHFVRALECPEVRIDSLHSGRTISSDLSVVGTAVRIQVLIRSFEWKNYISLLFKTWSMGTWSLEKVEVYCPPSEETPCTVADIEFMLSSVRHKRYLHPDSIVLHRSNESRTLWIRFASSGIVSIREQ